MDFGHRSREFRRFVSQPGPPNSVAGGPPPQTKSRGKPDGVLRRCRHDRPKAGGCFRSWRRLTCPRQSCLSSPSAPAQPWILADIRLGRHLGLPADVYLPRAQLPRSGAAHSPALLGAGFRPCPQAGQRRDHCDRRPVTLGSMSWTIRSISFLAMVAWWPQDPRHVAARCLSQLDATSSDGGAVVPAARRCYVRRLPGALSCPRDYRSIHGPRRPGLS
jgi:hypothetical protein